MEILNEFRGIEQEYDSVHKRAGLIDLSSRGRIKATGKDRTDFLNRLLSIDVKSMKMGECRTGCFLEATGKIQCVVDVIIAGVAIWLDTHESSAAETKNLFEKFRFSEEVQFEDVSGRFQEMALEGPESAKALERLREAMPGRTFVITEKSVSNEKGFRIWAPHPVSIPQDIERVGLKAFEAIRIEAKEPRFGVDIDASTLQPETGHDEWASTTKGCYPGQEIIQRVRNFGHPARLLMRIACESAESITGGKIMAEGKEAGRITSSEFSPRLKKFVALGMVHFSQAQAGKKVDIEIGNKNYLAELF